MPTVTPVTPLSLIELPDRIPANHLDGYRFTLSDPGYYSLISGEPWYYHASDSQAIADMTAVAANVAATFLVTDTPVTKYVKTAEPYVTQIKVRYQERQEYSSPNNVVRLDGFEACPA